MKKNEIIKLVVSFTFKVKSKYSSVWQMNAIRSAERIFAKCWSSEILTVVFVGIFSNSSRLCQTQFLTRKRFQSPYINTFYKIFIW